MALNFATSTFATRFNAARCLSSSAESSLGTTYVAAVGLASHFRHFGAVQQGDCSGLSENSADPVHFDSPSCFRYLFGIDYQGVLFDCSPQVSARAAVSRCDAGHAPNGGACRDRDCVTGWNSSQWRSSTGKAFRVAPAGWCDGNPQVSVFDRCLDGRAGCLDRRARDHLRRILGGRAGSRAPGESQEFSSRCGRASSLRWIFTHCSFRIGARRNRDGAIVARSARRRIRVRCAHIAHVDGKYQARLEDNAAQLRVAPLTFW